MYYKPKNGLNLFRYTLKSSTTTLANHLDMQHQINSNNVQAIENRTLPAFNPLETPRSSAMSKSILGRSLAMMICEDLLPFNIVSGNGFKNFLLRNKIVHNVEEIPTNVSISTSCLNDIYVLVRQRLISILTEAPHVINFATDLWTSKHGSIPYITLCVRFMDKNLKLQNFTLTTEHLPKPHTSQNIAKILQEIFLECEIDDRNFIAVGDNGKNVKAIPRHLSSILTYISCLAHNIYFILTTDIERDERMKPALDVIKLLKRIHGALVYQLPQLKEYFLLQQGEKF